MPLFEYLCRECESEVEILHGRGTQPSCPLCESKNLKKLISMSTFKFAGGSPTKGITPIETDSFTPFDSSKVYKSGKEVPIEIPN